MKITKGGCTEKRAEYPPVISIHDYDQLNSKLFELISSSFVRKCPIFIVAKIL